MEPKINKNHRVRNGLLFVAVLAAITGSIFVIIKNKKHDSPAVSVTKTVHFEFDNNTDPILKEYKTDTTHHVKLPEIKIPFIATNTDIPLQENENLSTEFSKNYAIPSIEKIIMKPPAEVQNNPDKVYDTADEMPLFNGGKYDTFRTWIEKNLRYPEIALENGIYGRVVIRFSINQKGEVCDVKVVKGVDPTLDKEAIRIISTSPKWTPGKIKGQPVKVQFNFTVYFNLK